MGHNPDNATIYVPNTLDFVCEIYNFEKQLSQPILKLS
jgi:hypothetical protein